jgi:ABC-type antimicrobial peptide transport system permease subunit
VLAPMTLPTVIGSLFGALGGSAVARILSSGISAFAGLDTLDPLAYLAAFTFFAAVVALAVFALSRRAIRVNPSNALQHE